MTILVVGKSGQVAQALAAAGRAVGVEVVTFGRPDLDLSQPRTVESAIARVRPTAVINAAAYTSVDGAESQPETARAINASGAGCLAELCARVGIPLVHLSTDYVFDGRKSGAYSEHDRVAPLNVYGHTKLEGEILVSAACRQHIIVRTSWVFSSHGLNFVKTMLQLARSRSHISVVDDQEGCPTYAPHLAAALLALVRDLLDTNADRVDPPWGIYHAAAQGSTTWCGLAREVFECAARNGGPRASVRPINTGDFPTAAVRPRNSRLDCRRLSRLLGLRLPHWRTGVAACIAELAAQGHFGTEAGLAAEGFG